MCAKEAGVGKKLEGSGEGSRPDRGGLVPLSIPPRPTPPPSRACSLDGNSQGCYCWTQAHLALALPGPPASTGIPPEPRLWAEMIAGCQGPLLDSLRAQLTQPVPGVFQAPFWDPSGPWLRCGVGPYLKLWLVPDSIQARLTPGGLPPALFAGNVGWAQRSVPSTCLMTVRSQLCL